MIETGAMVVAQWVAIGIMATGLGATWVRNGRSASAKYGALEEKVGEQNGKLDNMVEKLSHIEEAQNRQAVHCAEISTEIASKAKANEKAIDEIKRK